MRLLAVDKPFQTAIKHYHHLILASLRAPSNDDLLPKVCRQLELVEFLPKNMFSCINGGSW